MVLGKLALNTLVKYNTRWIATTKFIVTNGDK